MQKVNYKLFGQLCWKSQLCIIWWGLADLDALVAFNDHLSANLVSFDCIRLIKGTKGTFEKGGRHETDNDALLPLSPVIPAIITM